MDEHEHESMADAFEVVPNDEPSIEDWEGIGPGPTANDQQRDEFGAPIRPVVPVRDGVRDTSRPRR